MKRREKRKKHKSERQRAGNSRKHRSRKNRKKNVTASIGKQTKKQTTFCGKQKK